MEHRKILADTTIVIDHLRKKDKASSALFKLIDKHDLFISAVSVFELYAGATDERKKSDIRNIMTAFEILPFTADVAEKAGEMYISLRKTNHIIEIKDIFIAATAIIHNVSISTLNRKHFERIKDVELI